MTKLSARKTKLAFVTGATAYHAGKQRSAVVECDNEFTGTIRLKGTRVAYPFAWGSVFGMAALKHADAQRAERKRK